MWAPDAALDTVLPSAEVAMANNPTLQPSARQAGWLLANTALAAISKSHGWYGRSQGVAGISLSLVLAEHVLTLDHTLIQRASRPHPPPLPPSPLNNKKKHRFGKSHQASTKFSNPDL